MKFVLDKTLENSEILNISEEGNQIYGEEGIRLYSQGESANTTYIEGLNNSVYAAISSTQFQEDKITKYSYDDFGDTENITSGFGYNGERKDDSGLIYLRARYYNPRIGRFIQIDTNTGKNENVESQNRYVYTINNPYKYTDKNGNFFDILRDAVKFVVAVVVTVVVAGVAIADKVGEVIADAAVAVANAIGNAVSNIADAVQNASDEAYNRGRDSAAAQAVGTPTVNGITVEGYTEIDGIRYVNYTIGGVSYSQPCPTEEQKKALKESEAQSAGKAATIPNTRPTVLPDTNTNTGSLADSIAKAETNTKNDDDDDEQEYGPYAKVKGHHIHMVALFKNRSNSSIKMPSYSERTAIAVSQKAMSKRGMSHDTQGMH